MLYLEQRDHVKGELEAIKRSLLTAAPRELGPELFPDLFPREEWTEDTDPTAEIHITNQITDSEVDEYLAMMGVAPRVK
jgi:hypothetical protein